MDLFRLSRLFLILLALVFYLYRGSSAHHDGVAQGALFLQCSHYLGYFPLLLPDGYVNADQVAAPLIDNGVQGDGGLAG